jgi:hypothetical protein
MLESWTFTLECWWLERGKKVELPYKEVQHKNPKEKTALLVLSTQPKDCTKAHDRVVHPRA